MFIVYFDACYVGHTASVTWYEYDSEVPTEKTNIKKMETQVWGELEAATLKTGYTTPKQRREDNAWKVEGTTDTET